MNAMVKMAAGLGALAVVAAAGAARAEEGEGPEHDKLVTFGATPAGPGEVELELMYEPAFGLHGTGSFERAPRSDEHVTTLALTYGLAEGLDVRAEAGVGAVHDAGYEGGAGEARSARGQGLTDTALQARWRLLQRPDGGLAVALRPGLVIPTGLRATAARPGLSQEYWSLELGLLATADAGPFTANAEATGSLAAGGERGDERGELRAGLAGGWQALPWLQPELELRYARGLRARGPAPEALSVIGGVAAKLGSSWALAAGAEYAVWGRNTEQEAGGLVSLKWAP